MAGKQTTTAPFTTADIERVGIIVTEIAELATALQGLATSAIDNGGESYNESEALAARVLSEKVGWLADLAASKLGAGSYRGSAEDWMLPPIYHAKEAAPPPAAQSHAEAQLPGSSPLLSPPKGIPQSVLDEIDRLAENDPTALECLLAEFDRKVH